MKVAKGPSSCPGAMAIVLIVSIRWRLYSVTATTICRGSGILPVFGTPSERK